MVSDLATVNRRVPVESKPMIGPAFAISIICFPVSTSHKIRLLEMVLPAKTLSEGSNCKFFALFSSCHDRVSFPKRGETNSIALSVAIASVVPSRLNATHRLKAVCECSFSPVATGSECPSADLRPKSSPYRHYWQMPIASHPD